MNNNYEIYFSNYVRKLDFVNQNKYDFLIRGC